MTTEANLGQWRGWKYYCKHENPPNALQSFHHSVTCGKTPITELGHHEDCVEGCGCIWDPSSLAYWKNHVSIAPIEAAANTEEGGGDG